MGWLVVHTKVNKEAMSEKNLIRQGFDTYLPKYKKIIRHARKTSQVVRPLFPRYLFVKINSINNNWVLINSTYGVQTIITMENKPVIVPKQVIYNIKANENSEGVIDIKPFSNKAIGEEIEIVEGAFKGKSGIFCGINENNRVKVLFNILGQDIKISMSALALA